MTNKLKVLSNMDELVRLTEQEFENFVKYICDIEKNVVKYLAPNHEQFRNLSFKTVLTAILRLLDARILDKKLHLIGIKILRKTIEVENVHTT